MYKEDEEEYKKRLERAKILRSSMGLMTAGENSNNNTSIQYDNEYINRLNRAKQLRNSVGMITTDDSFSQDISNNYEKDDYNYLQDKYDMEKTRENIGNTVLNAAAEIVKNPFAQAKVPAKNITTSEQTKRELTDEEKETIRNKINEFNNTNNQNINNNLNENKSDNNVNIATQLTNKGTRLATQNELNNAQPISNSQIDATIEADKLNKQIKKGGKDAFEAYMETIGNNIFAGLAKKPIAGLANVATTIAGFGVKGLENWAKLLNFNEVGDSLNNAYSDIIDFGKKINEKANYESVLTSQIEDDFTRGSGQVTDVISNMIGNQAIGYAIGIPGTAVQGLTVGGSSAQEVLNENKNNIGQATITGLAKGYTSYLTEKMFDANILTRGESNSISKLIDKEISKKISSNLGKELANKTIGIVGENLEELVEDNVDNIIDKLVNNKDLPDFKQWWENTKETAKVTTISTIIMNLIGLGGETFNNKEMNIQAENWVIEAKKIINQENMAIHYDPRQVKSKNTMEQFYVTQFNQEGQIENIEPTLGKEIKNIQPQLMITPVIVKDINTNLYEVIDGATGVVLDNDYYNSIEEAEQSYNEKVKNISDNRITNINNTVNEANYIIKNNLMSVVTQIQEQLPEIAEQYYQNNNSNSTDFNQNKNTDVFNNETSNYTTEKVKTEYEQNNENRTPEKSKFYEDKPNYAVSNINEIETELNKKNSYSLEQIGETWSDIQENTYDLTLDDNMYVELEENNGKLEAVLYDGSTEEIPEINRVTVEKTKNGRYTAEAINNAVKEVATVQDENSPIQGQVDIEGNIVKQSSKNIDNIKDQLHNRIQNAIINKKSKGKTYLGDISDKVKNRIKKLLNIDVTGRRHVLADNDIRHMIKEHGDEKKEKTKGQIPITLNDIEKIPDILNSFDKIIIGNDNKEGKTIRYVKNYTNNVSYVVEVVPEEGKVLKIKTMWKKPVRVTNSQKTPSSTSKTKSNLDSTTSVTNSIPQNNKSVKNDENTISNKYIQNKRNNTNIQDFGEKIGGARKDLSTPRMNTKPGKEVIHDYTVEKTDNGYTVNFKGKVLNDGFKTQTEAEQYILDFKNNIKNNRAFVKESNGMLMTSGNKYLVYLRSPRTLKSHYIGKSFANEQDAENYAMALSMYLKENGKNLFRPQIQKVERTNANNKNATKATGNDILNNFGFKGGEFGNWVTQNERQQFLNYAQDAFTDLAAALDVTPDSLGQQKAMSIAFGARGQGFTGAVAHFEPGKKVINMTRLKGAGSLAHEYGHSIDNYLSRVGGYNEDGMVTENLRNPKLSDNMKNAIKEVTDAMKYNISTNQEEIDKKNAIYEKGRKDSLETHLSYLDNVFNGNQTTYKYNRKTKQREQTKIQVTDKQKQRYQDIRKILLNGDLDSKRTFVGNSLSSNNFEYGETIENLKSLYKEVVGRKINDDTIYWLYRYGQPAQQVSQIKSESAYSKSALELDRETGRATAYFSRTDEMWARAFESYISDKLKAKGIKDTYLVHSVNNNEYALFNPFPAGEERKNINKAFDNLIQTMKDEGLFTSSGTPQNIDEDTGIRYMKKNTSKAIDNQGRTLTKQQQEYFKDSKVRNEKGNLETVYHGTLNYGFTEFEGGHWGANYYTNNKNVAESYFINSSKNNGIYEGYLNITKPLEVDMQGRNWSEIRRDFITDKEILDLIDQDFGKPYDIFSTTDVIIAAKKSGKYDGVIFKNIYDDASSRKINLGNDYVTFNSNQFKNIDNQNPTSNSDIRYMKKSITKKVIDNKGNTLSQEQQNYFKNSKLRNNKNELEVVYHTTPNIFTEFDDSKLGDNTLYDNTAFGHFVTTNEEFSKRFGDIDNKGIESHTMEMYANVENPITHPYNAHYKYSGNELDNIVIKYFEAINEKEGLEQLKEFAEEEETSLYDMYMNMTIDNDLFDNAAEERKILKEKGYDAVEFVEGLESNLIENSNSNKPVSSYAIFNSKQLKNINNTTPTANNDIRFAKRSAKEINDNLRNAERGESYIEQEIQKIEKTGNWDNSIPVTKLSDIRKTIENYLGLGIKKGHFRQDAYAIYKGNNDVIRTKEYKDMDSILHETGHAMDLGNRLKIDKEAIADELLTAIDKLGGYEDESRTIKLEEGFAEVIREYSIVPEQAKQDYPQTVAVLEGLRKTDKKFNDFITKVQQQSYNYIHQNPRNRTLSNMSVGEQTDKQRITKNLIKQEVMRNIYDKDWAVKSAVNELAKANGKTVNQVKASENAYYLTRLASGISDKVVSMLSDGYIDEKGNKLFPGLGKIGEILGDNPERYNDHRASLVANRDVDYRAKTLKTGLRNMDTKAVREQFKNDTQIQQANKLVYDTLNGVMQYAVDNGLISQENAESLKQSNTFYIPMQRVIENRGNQVGKKGAVADIIKQRTGSELDVKDVYENIIANSSNIIRQVENNNILKAFYKEGQATGLTGTVFDVIDAPMTKIGTQTLEIWEKELQKQGVNTKGLDLEKTIDLFAPNKKVDAQNLITSFIDDSGKRIYLQFNDEILFNSLMNMDKKFMSQVLKINSKMNMPLRYGATMANLGFAIPNMISDTAQAAVYSTAGFIPVVDNALGVLDILASTNNKVRNFVNRVAPTYATRINKLYSLYQQSGATNSTRLSQYRESTQNLMSDVYGTKSKNLGIKEKYKPLKRLLDILTYIPEISEQSTRFRVFEKNYEYYKNKGTAEMDSRILAALESRDATQDFGRTGNITREINQLIPFSAARVGSVYTFTEKIKANPKQVGLRIAILTAIAMGIKAIGYDDKEIEELNQRKKDDNFIMRVGDDIVTIKKPQGILRSIINLAEYIQDLSTDHIVEGKEGERLGQWLNNAMMDNMPADEVTGLVPNAVAPLIENAINKDFYYNTDIVKSYDQDLPDAEQYYDYNSQLAIWLGKIFNYSPAKIDNLISGYFGGLGTSVTNTMDYALGKMGITPEKPEMGAEQNAIGKRFIVNVNSNSSSIDEIYNRKTELTKLQNGGTISSKEEEELKTIKAALSNITDLNKQIKEIKKDLTMSGSEKANKIKVIQQEKTDTARQALGKDLIHSENKNKIQSTQFYPNDTLKKNGYSLTLNSTQKKEYEKIASDFYLKYERQGLYNKEKLEDIKAKAKEYAKNQMFQKYRTNLVKTK